jgi:hypothetical protein
MWELLESPPPFLTGFAVGGVLFGGVAFVAGWITGEQRSIGPATAMPDLFEFDPEDDPDREAEESAACVEIRRGPDLDSNVIG